MKKRTVLLFLIITVVFGQPCFADETVNVLSFSAGGNYFSCYLVVSDTSITLYSHSENTKGVVYPDYFYLMYLDKTIIQQFLTPVKFDGQDKTQPIFQSSVNTIPDTSYRLGNQSLDYYRVYYQWGWSGGSSAYGNYNGSTLYITTEPSTPRGLSFPTVGQTTVQLSWNNGANPSTTSYTVQRKTGSNGAYGDIYTANNLTNYSDTGLIQNTTYYYRIRANGKNGKYYYSVETPVLTATDPVLLAASAAKTSADNALSASTNASNNAQIAANQGRLAYQASQNNVLLTNSVLNQANQIKDDTTKLLNKVNSLSATLSNGPSIQIFRAENGLSMTDKALINLEIGVSSLNSPTVQVCVESRSTKEKKYYIVSGASFIEGTSAQFSSLPGSTLVNGLPLFQGENLITLIVKDASGQISRKELTIQKGDTILSKEFPEQETLNLADSTEVDEFKSKVSVTIPSGAVILALNDDGLPAYFTKDSQAIITLNNQSNPSYYAFSLDGITFSSITPQSKALLVTLKDQCTNTVYIKSYDDNQVAGLTHVYRIVRDGIAPKFSAELAVSNQTIVRSGSVQVHIDVSEENRSNLEYRVNSGNWEKLTSQELSISLTSGLNKISIFLKDQAGNISNATLKPTLWKLK